jgi:polyisoprenoid-binding protein YceI
MIAVLGVLGFAAWWFIFRDDAPPKVSLAGALDSITATTATTAPGNDPSSGSTPGAAATSSTASATTGDLSGTWVPDTSQNGFVGYRVVEQLVRIGANTAVGRTSGVTGQVVIAGNTVQSATITADMTKLQSDNNQRDGQLRNQAIQTSRFPTSQFVLSNPVTIPDGLPQGQSVEVTLVGTLTLHGVTKAVSIPAQAKLSNGLLVVVGSIDIKFSDYQISQPNGASVLSIEDHGTMELQLFLKRS